MSERHLVQLDELTRERCKVLSHLILTLRNVPADELTADDVRGLLCSSLFLGRRHTWNKPDVPPPAGSHSPPADSPPEHATVTPANPSGRMC